MLCIHSFTHDKALALLLEGCELILVLKLFTKEIGPLPPNLFVCQVLDIDLKIRMIESLFRNGSDIPDVDKSIQS